MPDLSNLGAVAARCEYVGSVEHKARRSWLGAPQPRRRKKKRDPEDHKQNATICPLVEDADRKRASTWVQEAIRRAQFGTEWRGGFPRHIWYRDRRGQYWYGFLTNQGAGADAKGQYKGWPIEEDEWGEDFG